MNVFLQIFGAGGIIGILAGIVALLNYLSNNKKNQQDGYSKVFQDQNTNMATIERERDKAREEYKELKKVHTSLERKFSVIVIYFKNVISSLEDDDKITTQEAYTHRTKIQEVEFSE